MTTAIQEIKLPRYIITKSRQRTRTCSQSRYQISICSHDTCPVHIFELQLITVYGFRHSSSPVLCRIIHHIIRYQISIQSHVLPTFFFELQSITVYGFRHSSAPVHCRATFHIIHLETKTSWITKNKLQACNQLL